LSSGAAWRIAFCNAALYLPSWGVVAVTADERQPAVERAGLAGGGAHSRPLLRQLGSVQKEAWLRNLLDACKHALDDLRETESVSVQSLVTDLERVCAKVQRHLDGIARASA
jgi:hypothetical protein